MIGVSGLSPGTGASAGANSAGGGAYSPGGATNSDAWGDNPLLNKTQNTTHATDQTFDVTQRYEPYAYHENSGFQRIDPPKNAEWLTDKGVISRLNEAYDEPVRFKGENDGQMYDLSDLGHSGNSFSSIGSSGAENTRET